jgi:hypothetical protein
MYPDARQKGISIMKVMTRLFRKSGVSPGPVIILVSVTRSSSDRRGLREKRRLIVRRLLKRDLPASTEPAAEAVSHDPRKTPVISSYPPVRFIISRISRS